MLLIMTAFYACKGGSKGGFQTTESGIQYQIFGENKGKKIEGGDFIDFHMVIKDSKDSIVQNTYTSPEGAFKNSPFPEDSTKGGILEGLRMLAAGDSAIFKISTDSMLKQRNEMGIANIKSITEQMEKQLSQAPDDSTKNRIRQMYEGQIGMIQEQISKPDPSFPPNKFITYIIKVIAVKSRADMEKEQEEAVQKQKEDAEKIKKEQDKTIQEYIKKNKLAAKSTESGLYYLITKEGEGAIPQKGDSVKVHYTGRILDGKIFDTSIEAIAKENEVYNEKRNYNEPFSFTLGQRQVIEGWDEGISLLKKGSKATLIIPFHLGYGDRGTPGGPIPPYAILMFEVELLK